jgi:hypothetical protein
MRLTSEFLSEASSSGEAELLGLGQIRLAAAQ